MKALQAMAFGIIPFMLSWDLSASPRSFCSNTANGKPSIEEGFIRCELQISDDSLAGTGIFDRLFSRVDIEIPIEFALIDLLLAFGENLFSAPQTAALIVGTTVEGKKIDLGITTAPLVYFKGESPVSYTHLTLPTILLV